MTQYFAWRAGYLANTTEWKLFEKEWHKALGGISDFHAKVFFKRDKFVKRLKPYVQIADPDAFLDKLIEIIGTHDIHPLASSIDVVTFNNFSLSQRRYLTGGCFDPKRGKWIKSGKPSAPFFLPFQHVITETCNRITAPSRVVFTFDQDEVRAPFMADLYNYGKTLPENIEFSEKIGDLLLANRIGTPGLQAADLLAHCWYQIGVGTANAQVHRCMQVLTRKQDLIYRFNESLMRTLLNDEDIPASVRASWEVP